jgi:fluoride ion exporter CrcB/FEX
MSWTNASTLPDSCVPDDNISPSSILHSHITFRFQYRAVYIDIILVYLRVGIAMLFDKKKMAVITLRLCQFIVGLVVLGSAAKDTLAKKQQPQYWAMVIVTGVAGYTTFLAFIMLLVAAHSNKGVFSPPLDLTFTLFALLLGVFMKEAISAPDRNRCAASPPCPMKVVEYGYYTSAVLWACTAAIVGPTLLRYGQYGGIVLTGGRDTYGDTAVQAGSVRRWLARNSTASSMPMLLLNIGMLPVGGGASVLMNV